MATQTMTQTQVEHLAQVEAVELQTMQPKSSNQGGEEGPTIMNEEPKLSRHDLLKVVAASMSFFFAGNNDGSLGALTPYILRTYHVGTEWIALM
jgi:hypothetical protein